MATNPDTVEFILDQLDNDPLFRAQKMFGEYALYLGNKVVALFCDDYLYVKVTDQGRVFATGNYQEAPAYPSAKPSMRIEEKIDDGEWLRELLEITATNLPEPKPKTLNKLLKR